MFLLSELRRLFSNEEQPRLSYIFINSALNDKYIEAFNLPLRSRDLRMAKSKTLRNKKKNK